jgi:hypothetical protein
MRPFLNGRDLTAVSRGLRVIDFYGINIEDVRQRFPECYQYLLTAVRPQREKNNRASYRRKWWQLGENMEAMRKAIEGLDRYVVSTRTARHRVFSFVSGDHLCDSKVNVFGSQDAYVLGILSSSVHRIWSRSRGGWLGVGNDHTYNHSECFDPFPFPDSTDAEKASTRAIAEDLDAHRKRVLAEHPHLTLTSLYNVLERLRAGAPRDYLDEAERHIFDDGLVMILKELHDRLDAAVADAYGWPADLPDEEILARLVALNKERAAEERRGVVRWLRPDYQIPRFGSEKERAAQIEADLVGGADGAPVVGAPGKITFPTDEMEQTAAVMAALLGGSGPLDAAMVAASFRQGRRIEPKVKAILAALARMGVATSADGGRSFSSRRSA